MTKILILGGSGMIGHQLFKQWKSKYLVMTTLRLDEKNYNQYDCYNSKNAFYGVDILDFQNLEIKIKSFNPDFIINAIGITKQRIKETDKEKCIAVNSYFPHKLSELCKKLNIKMLQLSTDCVFSGSKGNYSESDTPDCNDLYGQSKLAGEIVNSKHALTIRKSTIGFEIEKKHGLLEWFLSEKGNIFGYKNVFFSGVTTIELSNIIENILMNFNDMHGLWHISGERINKHELLQSLKILFNKNDIKINVDRSIAYDRTLNGSKFATHTKYYVPEWKKMLKELYDNSIFYSEKDV